MKKSFGESLRRERQKGLYWGIVAFIILIFCMLFILYPFGKLFLQSFFEDGHFSLANYAKFFGRSAYRKVLGQHAEGQHLCDAVGRSTGSADGLCHHPFQYLGQKGH